MAFQQPQARRTRHAQAVQEYEESPPTLEDSGELSHSVDREVLLFGGAGKGRGRGSSSAQGDATVGAVEQSWHLLDHPTAHTLRSTSLSTRSSSQSTTNGAGGGSPRSSLTHSLFPSHDGGGIFIAGSLVHSDSNNATLYSTTEDDASSASASASAAALSDTSGSSSSARVIQASYQQGLVGEGSWALTEAALSTVPHATPLGNLASVAGPGSAEYTGSDSSSDDESLEGIVVGRRRTPTRRRGRGNVGNEQGLSLGPSAGLGSLSADGRGRRSHAQEEEDTSSSRSNDRDAYPSPPPEGASSFSARKHLRTHVKRRHRQSGRATAGSQKRSSTSGSVAGAESASQVPLAPALPTLVQASAREAHHRARAEKQAAAAHVFLGGVASRLMDVETSTLELFVDAAVGAAPLTPEATPTPSRAASPTGYAYRRRRREQGYADGAEHGVEALARMARDELGDSAMGSVSASGGWEAEDEGDETETEVDHHNHPTQHQHKQWHTQTSPPTLAPRTTAPSAPQRTFSASSLPLYLATHSHTSVPPLTTSTSTLKPVPAPSLLRRTSSSGGSGGEENPWGGEFEGFEAAMSYWRRLLRRMRGF